MAFPIIPKRRSGSAGNPTSLQLGELATNTATGELFLGGDAGVMLLNAPTSAGTTVTEHTGDGSTVAFTFTGYSSTADGAYIVSVGGIDQPPSKYSISNTNGGTITFVEAPVAGELISIRAIVAGGGGGSGDATSLQGRPVLNQAPDANMSLTWVNDNWQPSFTLELAGTPLADPFTATDGQVLAFDATTSKWTPTSLSAGGGGIRAWNAATSYVVGDVVYDISVWGLFIYRCITANTNENPYNNWTNWQTLNASAFFIGKDSNGIACAVDPNGIPVTGNTLIWNSTTGYWEFATISLPTIEATNPPSNDGGLSAAGINPAGWLSVNGYKVPYFQ